MRLKSGTVALRTWQRREKKIAVRERNLMLKHAGGAVLNDVEVNIMRM